MEEDIFMDYTTSSSGQASPVSSFSVPFEAIRLGRRLDELKSHKENIVSALKSDSNNRILVLDMRRYNRHLFGVVNEHRKRLNELKTSIDSLNNRLLCHKFEKQHLLNEIEACKNSKNIYNTIDLDEDMDEYKDLPEHEKMIKKLHCELSKRQTFQERLMAILQRKLETESELASKKRKLEDLKIALQSLLKNCKPVSDACGHEDRKKFQMETDDDTKIPSSMIKDSTTSTKDSKEILLSIYEKLVSFVSDKSDYKLRYFEELVAQEDDTENNDVDDDSKASDYIVDEGRNSSIKSAYIHIELKRENDGDDPLNLYLKVDNEVLLLSCSHELIPETCSATWIKGLNTIDVSVAENSCWCAPESLQNDPIQDNYEQVFVVLNDAIVTRKQLQEMIDETPFLEFDKNNLNTLYLLPSKDLKAEVSMTAVTWSSDSLEYIELLSELNTIGSKYRSVLDCLKEQVSLLLSKLSLNDQ